MLFLAAALTLHLELVRHSLTGTHYRYGQYVDDQRMVGAEVDVTIRPDGKREEERNLVSGAPAIPPARVFLANPAKTLNDPALQDQNNSPAAVPDAAYSTVDLDDVNPSGPLGGPYVQITDIEAPNIAPVDASQSLVIDRSQTAFEDVNAYVAVDRSQRYLQSLGYKDSRSIAQYPIPVDTHALGGADDSIFVPSSTPGQGRLLFGDGWNR